MPMKSGRLTPQETKFVTEVAAHGNGAYAAKRAGYKFPDVRAAQLRANPAIQAAIAKEQTERLFIEGLPAAVDRLVYILKSDKAPAGAQVSAAKLVFDRTLGTDPERQTKQLHEMTPEEIDEQINRLRQEVAQRARPVIEAEQSPDASVLD